jgi:spore coat assembly protein
MLFNIGDYVTRKSHNHDMVFKIIEIKNRLVLLEGINVRLIADSDIDDLEKCNMPFEDITKEDRSLFKGIQTIFEMDRDHYFYLPGKVLHIDGDKNYLNRCMDLYKNMNISAYGLVINEREISSKIMDYLNEIRPDVLVITGHDAYYDSDDENSYKNSSNFIKAVKTAREYERDHDKLIIVAGACQSDYESLIKAGANFASSPKRINIHALDPAIIASSVCLSRKSEPIDLMKILSRTKYGKDGIGGIITNGTMYVGYPR